ncbi:gamma-glutamylcyclotransferase [Sulfitobacter sp. W027]|jgi:hypothetical protein|uniref:gamma-glutamylcyclotransferase family protein n=1 Tax=Sulfitobacter sp. W027 TaxID=2867025 RepID=UPI0021A94DA9|nr:gamma-glutamylcyclotransferase family protein [Sulfitobacter sp. W027]UWR33172.1 gamma-glutamylcyclotransferase [Sulfitobacter sp. W027]
MTPYFFGYGSLVNRNTHSYPDARPAQLDGWRRQWIRTEGRDIVYLSVVQNPATRIDGLIAAVPGADWAALDKREYSYERHASGGAVVHDLAPAPDIAHYAIPADIAVDHGDHVILLSYLDVVVQGFLREFGTDGAARFFDTTDGWDTPILNDRAAPIYPRHQTLTEAETTVVDQHMNRLSVQIKQREETTFAARNF